MILGELSTIAFVSKAALVARNRTIAPLFKGDNAVLAIVPYSALVVAVGVLVYFKKRKQ